MNRRQRFLETMTFGRPDRPASGDYFFYDATRERWQREGLPLDADLNEYFGMDFDPFRQRIWANLGIIPDFGTTVLEESDDYRVERRPGGEVVRILQNVPPPAMPQWIRYPLTSRGEWEQHAKRLDPGLIGRLPGDLARIAAGSDARDYPLGMWLGGSYGVMRNWWGVEALSYLFFDDPGLVDEMVDVLTRLSLGVFEAVLRAGVRPDWVMFWEDMAYKNGPLVSPELYEKHCTSFYDALMEAVRGAGIPVVMLDSDGDIGDLIPIWLDRGIFVMHPMEVAAGMDVRAVRKQYGRRVGFFGGIDKRALAGTREQLRADVVPKLEGLWGDGGFIPACDHAIPPDVSFDNYRYYRDLVRDTWDRMRG